jgi:cob(I)alamin adenosyltransferase
LKAAFAKAAEAQHKPPSGLIESFMRAYVRRSERRAFATEARRQSREAAALSLNSESDEFVVMAEIEAELAEVWGEP